MMIEDHHFEKAAAAISDLPIRHGLPARFRDLLHPKEIARLARVAVGAVQDQLTTEATAVREWQHIETIIPDETVMLRVSDTVFGPADWDVHLGYARKLANGSFQIRLDRDGPTRLRQSEAVTGWRRIEDNQQ